MVAAALAVLAGAWLGAALHPTPLALAALVAGAACGWLALELAAAADARDGTDATAGLRAGARLVLLGSLALAPVALGWRGRAAARRGPQLEASLAGPIATLEGSWEPLRRTRRGELGKLHAPGEAPLWLELEAGSATRGEWLRVRPNDRPRREARGPVEPPHAPFGAREHLMWSARPDEVERLALAPAWERGTSWVGDLRALVARRCAQFADGTSRALAHALLYGATERLEPELSDTFAHTGMRHVLAVSGMHVSLLAAVLIAPWVGGGRRRRLALVLLAGSALALFAAITGGAAPVRRAAVALGLTLAAPLCARAHGEPRRVDTLSLLALALLVEAALDLDSLFSVSLLLSYLATLGLVLLTGPIRRALPQARPPVELGPTSARRALASVASRATRSAVAASLATVLVTLPLCWSTFGEWASIGVLAKALDHPGEVLLLAI
ncbi:MAG: ComEC/Rec2 family competence protein, partial [Planctomycetota bacterium]